MTLFEKHAREIQYCTFCPKMCRFACTVADAEKRETVTPTGKMSLLHLLREGRIKLDPSTASIFYKCTHCMTCREYCAHDIVIPPVLDEARALAVEKGLAPKELVEVQKNFAATGNPNGKNLKAMLADLVPEQYQNSQAQVLYFPGCAATLNQQQMITDTFKIFEKLDIDYVGVDPLGEICCGYPLTASGFTDMFEEHVKKTGKRLANYKKIISGCPTCVYYLKTIYPEHGFNIASRVEHTTTFLAERLEKVEPAINARGIKVCYYDPCYMSRYLGVIEPPRELLKKFGAELYEMTYTGAESRCCGGGGMFTATNPKGALSIARKRWDDFLATGADLLVTSCPSCEWMLSEKGERKLVVDLVNFIAGRL